MGAVGYLSLIQIPLRPGLSGYAGGFIQKVRRVTKVRVSDFFAVFKPLKIARAVDCERMGIGHLVA